MIKYLFNKLLFTLGVLLSVSLITFILSFVLPSDPARALLGIQADESAIEGIRKELKLDKPLPVQYWESLKRLSRGDLGRSYITNRDVKSLIAERFAATFKLAIFAITVATILGIAVGSFAVYTNSTAVYKFLTSLSVIFASIPVFFLGLLVSLFIGSYLKLLPISGYEQGLKGIKYIILPGITLGIYPMALIARLTASRLREIMESDYVKAHFAMGIKRWKIVLILALRNAMNPVITVIGNSVAILLSGAFFVEYIFSWPGIGLLWVDSVLRYDFPVITGIVMFSAMVFVVVNMIVDLLHPIIDPRIRVARTQ